MALSSAQEFGVLNTHFASQAHRLEEITAIIGRLHQELAGIVSDLAWDRARLDGLVSLHVGNNSIGTAAPAVDAILDNSDTQSFAVAEMAPAALDDDIRGDDATDAFCASDLAFEPAVCELAAAFATFGDVPEISEQISFEAESTAVVDATSEQFAALTEADKIEKAIGALSSCVSASVASEQTFDEPVAQPGEPIEAANSSPADCEVENPVPVLSFPAVRLASVKIETADAALESPHGDSATSADVGIEATATPPATAKVVDLANRRRGRSSTFRRSVAAVASLIAVAAAPMVYDDIMQSEIGLQLSRLGACSIQSIRTDHDCAALVWLAL